MFTMYGDYLNMWLLYNLKTMQIYKFTHNPVLLLFVHEPDRVSWRFIANRMINRNTKKQRSGSFRRFSFSQWRCCRPVDNRHDRSDCIHNTPWQTLYRSISSHNLRWVCLYSPRLDMFVSYMRYDSPLSVPIHSFDHRHNGFNAMFRRQVTEPLDQLGGMNNLCNCVCNFIIY